MDEDDNNEGNVANDDETKMNGDAKIIRPKQKEVGWELRGGKPM